jgi:CheY-like chemotaxis protein
VTETRGPVILLVDANLDNREMYTEYLRTRGYEVIPCGDGQECVDLARRHHPDLILLELRMDGMTGIEILAHLKAERSLAGVPIVALTASVLPFQRREALDAGFTRVIPKPCLPEDLAGEIATMLSVRP